MQKLFLFDKTLLMFCCSVDASRAGQGPLTIDIMFNGQLIPAQISQDPHRDKQFNVKFRPRGAGFYTVRVFFSDVEITGKFYSFVCRVFSYEFLSFV